MDLIPAILFPNDLKNRNKKEFGSSNGPDFRVWYSDVVSKISFIPGSVLPLLFQVNILEDMGFFDSESEED